MNAFSQAWQVWLLANAVGGVCLAAGVLAAAACREPIRRLRVIQWTLVVTLAAPLANQAAANRWIPPLWKFNLNAATTDLAGDGATTARAAMVTLGDDLIDETVGQVTTKDGSHDERQSPLVVAVGTAGPSMVVVDERDTRTVADIPPVASSLTTVEKLASVGLWLNLLVTACLAGVWSVALARLAKIRARSRPADERLRAMLDELSGAAAPRVRLLIGRDLASPITFGWARSTIVMPERLLDPARAAALRMALAHEWSHAARGDLWTMHLANLAVALFSLQPLAWWMRRQARLCQDFIADAGAAEVGGSRAEYASLLLDLAKFARPRPIAALSFGERGSNLRRRVRMLVERERPPRAWCGATWSMSTASVALAALAAASAVRLDAGDQPSTTDADRSTGEAVVAPGRVMGRDWGEVGVGKPISGARVEIRIIQLDAIDEYAEKLLKSGNHKTDADGRFEVVIPAEYCDQPDVYVEANVTHPNYTATTGIGGQLRTLGRAVRSDQPSFLEGLRLEHTPPVTGRLEYVDGRPAEGVWVLAYSPAPKTENATINRFHNGEITRTRTAADGTFALGLAHDGMGILWCRPKSAAPLGQIVANRPATLREAADEGDREFLIRAPSDLGTLTLARGGVLRGRAIDTRGDAVANVWVNAYREPHLSGELVMFVGELFVSSVLGRAVLTDEDGNFEFPPLAQGEYKIWVRKTAEDLLHMRNRTRPLGERFPPVVVSIRDGEENGPIELRAIAPDHPTAEPLVVPGRVMGRELDGSTWRFPIAGAKIDVRLIELDPVDEYAEKVLESMTLESDAEGRFEVTIPARYGDSRELYVDVTASHPKFTTITGLGTTIGSLGSADVRGAPTIFERIELGREPPLTGIVVNPDGTPAANVPVTGFSPPLRPYPEPFDFWEHSLTRTRTAEDGSFTLGLAHSGVGFLWFAPKNAAPESRLVATNMGDLYEPEGRGGRRIILDGGSHLGTISLERGAVLRGVVLDEKGRPIPNVWVSANGDEIANGEVAMSLEGAQLDDSLYRAALTDKDGRFELPPLADGAYRVNVDADGNDLLHFRRRPRKVEHVFTEVSLKISRGIESQPLELRALDQVAVRATCVDGKGAPVVGQNFVVSGTVGGQSFLTEAKSDQLGKIEVRVPRGLENAHASAYPPSGMVVKFRKDDFEPFQFQRSDRHPLGTVDHDLDGIELVRYLSPVLVVRAVDAHGAPIPIHRVTAFYSPAKGSLDTEYPVDIVVAEVPFAEGADGRFRSSRLLPDEGVTITVIAEGHEEAQATVKLAEGENRELDMVMKKKS